MVYLFFFIYFFFFNDTATTEIYTLSLHDALPIWRRSLSWIPVRRRASGSSRHQVYRSPGRSLLSLCLQAVFLSSADLSSVRSALLPGRRRSWLRRSRLQRRKR